MEHGDCETEENDFVHLINDLDYPPLPQLIQQPLENKEIPIDEENLPMVGENLPTEGEDLPKEGENLPQGEQNQTSVEDNLPTEGEIRPTGDESLPTKIEIQRNQEDMQPIQNESQQAQQIQNERQFENKDMQNEPILNATEKEKNDAQEITVTASVYQEDMEMSSPTSLTSKIESSHITPAQQQNISKAISQQMQSVGEMSSSGFQNIASNLDLIERQFYSSPVLFTDHSNPSTTFRKIDNTRENQCATTHHEDRSIEMMSGLNIAGQRNIENEEGFWSQSSTTVPGNEKMDDSESSDSSNEDISGSRNKRVSKFGDIDRNVKGRYDDSAC